MACLVHEVFDQILHQPPNCSCLQALRANTAAAGSATRQQVEVHLLGGFVFRWLTMRSLCAHVFVNCCILGLLGCIVGQALGHLEGAVHVWPDLGAALLASGSNLQGY